MRHAKLVTASCTTGWGDWIHSELWMFDDGLLVAKTDLARTLSHGTGPTVASPPTTREFTSDEIALMASSARTNMWLDASTLTSASFHRGKTVGGVKLEVAGRARKLLWLENDRPEEALREAFLRWGVSVI